MKVYVSAATNDQLQYYCDILNDACGFDETDKLVIRSENGRSYLAQPVNGSGIRQISPYMTKKALLDTLDTCINVLTKTGM